MILPAPSDVYQRITDQIVAAIEAGAGEWKMPWHYDQANAARPVNVVSGKPYRGVNVLALWATAQVLGYSSPQWATYKQWQEKGAQVRKGEKSSLVVFWKVSDFGNDEETQPDQAEDESSPSGRRAILARGYSVFNADQVDGYTAPALPALPVIARIEHAERFFAHIGVEVKHGGGRAYYQPTTDHIQMPPFEVFRDAVAYYAVLGHETMHWTGAKSRLDRDLKQRFGTEAYAAEELVAELGAAFLCADLALANAPRPDHAAYVARWLRVLKGDPRALFTAAAKAQQAADYLHGLQPEAEPTATPVDAIQTQPSRPAAPQPSF